MRKPTKALLLVIPLLFGFAPLQAESNLSIGVVNFRQAVEKSRAGKHEQETFEGMKTQMESILSEKEKVLTDLAQKVNDPDHLDSLSPEAEEELNNRFRSLGQEFGQVQNQYMQALQQANMKILQKLASYVSNAAEKIAAKKNLNLVLNEDNTFYYADTLDITDDVVVEMDQNWKDERKKLLDDLKAGNQSGSGQ